MKILFFILAALTISSVSQAQSATPRDFGIGLAIGSPTALTGKIWLTNTTAMDFGLAYSSRDYLLIYGDYLLHDTGLFQSNKFTDRLTTYFGFGLGIYSWDRNYYYGNRPAGWRSKESDLGVYIRVPIGAEWRPVDLPIGVFAELVPGLSVVPSIDVIINAAIGIRYYF